MAVCDVIGCLIRFVVVVVVVAVVCLPTSVTTASPPSGLPPPDWLLIESLSTFAVEACDGQSVRLRCPRGTTVGVRSALYESTSAAACANTTDYFAANGPSSARLEDDDGASMRSLASSAGASGVSGSGYVDAEPRRHQTSDDRNRGERLTSTGGCIAVNSLEVVISLCEAKAQCSVRVASRLFNRPSECTSVSGQTLVYRLSVTYQCRPSDVRIRPVCPGQSITLSCPRSDLLVLPSAVYVPLTGGPCSVDGPSSADNSGPTRWPPQATEHTPFRDCGPTEGAGGPRGPLKDSTGSDGGVEGDEAAEVYRWTSANCPALSAVERCHGRQSCTIFAAWCRHRRKQTIVDDRGLAAAVVPQMTALRVAYACVSPGILRTPVENDQWRGSTAMTSFIPAICAVKPPIDLVEGESQPDVWSTSSATTLQVTSNDSEIIGRRSVDQPVLSRRSNGTHDGTHWYIDDDWIWTWAFLSLNAEKILLYASLGALIGLIFLLVLVAVRLRLLHTRRRRESRAFRFATCPCSTSSAFQVSSTRTARSAADEYDGVTAVDVSSARCLTLAGDRTLRSTAELDEEDRWRTRSRDDDRCAAAEQCGASCATLLKSRTMTSSSSTNRPILQLDDD